jgi:hypothetical protein
MATTKPICDKHKVRKMAGFYLKSGQFRDYCLAVLGVNIALRISGLLRPRW